MLQRSGLFDVGSPVEPNLDRQFTKVIGFWAPRRVRHQRRASESMACRSRTVRSGIFLVREAARRNSAAASFHPFAPAFHKRRLFRQEVRAVMVWPSYRDLADGITGVPTAAGMAVPVDLSALVSE